MAARSLRSTRLCLVKILVQTSKNISAIVFLITLKFFPCLFIFFRRRSVGCALSTTSASCWPTAFTHWPIGTAPFQREWSMTLLQAQRKEPQGCWQPRRRGTERFPFASRSLHRPVRTGTSASLRRDEDATRVCKRMPWSTAIRLPPLHFFRRVLRDSTPDHQKFSASTRGTTIFKAATIPPLVNDLNLHYSIQNEKTVASPLAEFCCNCFTRVKQCNLLRLLLLLLQQLRQKEHTRK